MPIFEKYSALLPWGGEFPAEAQPFFSSIAAVGHRVVHGMHHSQPERVMDVDYKRYGKGEALMGWYNATLALRPAATRMASKSTDVSSLIPHLKIARPRSTRAISTPNRTSTPSR